LLLFPGIVVYAYCELTTTISRQPKTFGSRAAAAAEVQTARRQK